MLGLDPVTAGSILVLAASPGNLCTMPRPTEITVTPSTKEVQFDYTQNTASLQNYAMDTIDPHGFGGVSTTQGFMNGAIRMDPRVKLNFEPVKGYNAVCLWYESVNIKLEIDPKIVIAKEVAEDSCMLKAVKEHEMKHVKADREIVNKYADIMGKKVYAELQQRGFISEPVKPENAKALAERMQKTVFQVLDHEYKKLDLERIEIQRSIDNKEEYDRVSAQCPDYQSKRMALKKQQR